MYNVNYSEPQRGGFANAALNNYNDKYKRYIRTNGYIPTLDFIGVDVDAVAKVALDVDTEKGIALAQKNFLNMTEDEIREALTDSLQGNMREIIGTINLKDICNNRQKFGDQVQEKAQRDMNALGVKIISCNIRNVRDENNLINDLGRDNMAQIQKNAQIAAAQAARDVAIVRAETKKESNDANIQAETEIAIKQNELEIKKAEAMKKYGQAAILEMIVNKLPEMAGAIAKPLEPIDKVTIIDGGGNGTGVDSMGGYVPSILAKTMESIKEVTCIDINEIVKADTYEGKTTRNINLTGLDDVDGKNVNVDKENV